MMRFRLWVIFWVLLGGLLLGGAVLILLLLPRLERWIQEEAFPSWVARTGWQMEVGQGEIHWFPLSWEVEGLRLRGPEGKQTLEVERVRIRLALLPLFHREVRIREILLVHPRGTLWISPESALPPLPAATTPQRTPWQIRIQQVTLQKGALRIQIPRHHLDARLEALEAQIRSQGEQYRARWTTQVTVAWQETPPIQGHLEGEGWFQPGKGLVLDHVRLTAFDDHLYLEAQGQVLPTWDLAVSVSLEGEPWRRFLSLKGLESVGLLKARLHLQGHPRTPRIQGDFSLDRIRIQGIVVQGGNGWISLDPQEIHLRVDSARVLGGEIQGEFLGQWPRLASWQLRLTFEGVHPFWWERIPPSLGGLIWNRDLWLEGEVRMEGQGRSLEHLQGEGALRGHLPGASLQATLRLSPGPWIRMGVQGSAQDVAQVVGHPKWPLTGPATLAARVEGPLTHPALEASVEVAPARFRGSPWTGILARIHLQEQVLRFWPLELQDGQGWLRAFLVWDLKATPSRFAGLAVASQVSLESVVSLTGKQFPLKIPVTGTLQVERTPKGLLGRGRLQAGSGELFQVAVAGGEIEARLDAQRVEIRSAQLWQGKTRIQVQGWVDYQGKANLQLTAPTLRLEDLSPLARQGLQGQGHLSLSLRGALRAPRLRGRLVLETLVVRNEVLGPVGLEVQPRPGGVEVHFQARDLGIRFRGGLDWKRTFPVQGVVEAAEVHLGRLIRLGGRPWPDAVAVRISGTGFVRGTLHPWALEEATLEGTRIHLQLPQYQVEGKPPLRAHLQQGQWILEEVGFLGEGTSLWFLGTLTPRKAWNLEARGQADLRLLGLLVPAMEGSRGVARLQVRIQGAWRQPEVRGTITLKDARLQSRDLGMRVDRVSASLFFDGRQMVLEAFQGRVGQGVLQMSGRVGLSRLIPLTLSDFALSLDLRRGMFRFPDLETEISASVLLQGTPAARELVGEIQIHRARYTRTLEWTGLARELRRLREGRPRSFPSIGDTRLRIHVVAQPGLEVQNNLAQVTFRGELILRGTLERPQVFGHLEAGEGTLVFRGNAFQIQTASVDFVSLERIRPVVDFQGQTRIQGYGIHLHLTGTPERLDLRLTSDPPLDETDILSLLTLGQTASQVAGAGAQIGAAELTFLLTAPLQARLSEELRRMTGVDRIRVDPYYAGSRSASGARITVSKSLFRDRLRVDYLFFLAGEQQDVIHMEYHLRENVFLVGERDELGRISGDLRFRFRFR